MTPMIIHIFMEFMDSSDDEEKIKAALELVDTENSYSNEHITTSSPKRKFDEVNEESEDTTTNNDPVRY